MRIYPDELAHFGIKGMKWGIRRYQNEDGTLTEEGKRRYGGSVEKVRGSAFRKQVSRFQSSSSNNNSHSQKAASEILKKAYSKADNSPEGKAFHKYDREIARAVQDTNKRGQTYKASSETMHKYASLNNAYVRKINEYIHSPEQQALYSSALLKDLGYEDTEAGRRYVSRMLGV